MWAGTFSLENLRIYHSAIVLSGFFCWKFIPPPLFIDATFSNFDQCRSLCNSSRVSPLIFSQIHTVISEEITAEVLGLNHTKFDSELINTKFNWKGNPGT